MLYQIGKSYLISLKSILISYHKMIMSSYINVYYQPYLKTSQKYASKYTFVNPLSESFKNLHLQIISIHGFKSTPLLPFFPSYPGPFSLTTFPPSYDRSNPSYHICFADFLKGLILWILSIKGKVIWFYIQLLFNSSPKKINIRLIVN